MTENAKTGTIIRPRRLPESLEALRRWLLRRIWYVHPGLTLTVNIPPMLCIRVLGTISRPDAARLEYRHLFAGGRRYHLQQAGHGFGVTTTSKIVWSYRGRTSSNAILFGEFEPVDETTTRIVLRGRIKLTHLLSSFLIPAFVSSLILAMPWHPLVLVVLVTLLFGLKWADHRLTAAIEVYEMIFFVQKALESYAPEPLMSVGAGGIISGTSRERDFVEAWEKFYDAHRTETHET